MTPAFRYGPSGPDWLKSRGHQPQFIDLSARA